jgi:hypothetical protein
MTAEQQGWVLCYSEELPGQKMAATWRLWINKLTRLPTIFLFGQAEAQLNESAVTVTREGGEKTIGWFRPAE